MIRRFKLVPWLGTCLAALSLSALAGAQETTAQPPPPPPPDLEPAEPARGMGGAYTHDGFYLQLLAGLGYLSATEDNPVGEVTYSGMTFPSAIAIGGSPIPGLAIAGGLTWDYAFSPSAEFGGASQDLDNVTLMLIGIGVQVDVYPDPGSGLHFQGLAGWGGLEAAVDGNVGGSDPTGLVLNVGGGYDFFVSDEWSIGPLFRFGYAPLSYNDISVNTIAPSLNVNFTYH